ncbi:helix-turn-helix domain-containing protein [Faecalispora anaeroviscerum]|nr:helix-turn-helix domain-containing protein [Faecalispora anaeroviscerum]
MNSLYSLRYREPGPLLILPLSRKEIANYLGIARETLSRKLNQQE